MQGQLAYIVPVNPENGEPGKPTQPWLPSPEHPIVLPPLPPGMEQPEHPIVLPPAGEHPEYPIYIPGTPTHPIALPPGTVWPPLNPGDGVQGKVLLLVVVIGSEEHKYRWVVVDAPTVWPTPPPAGQPK
jgi:hypothetical protein